MIPLLLKDFLLLKKQLGLMTGIVLLFAVFAGTQTSILLALMTTMMMSMISINTLAYDQHDGWDAYACVLPLSRTKLIVSKYLLAGICIAVSVILVMLTTLLFGKWKQETLFFNASAQIAFGLVLMSGNFPLILKYGYEKSRVYYIILTGIFMGLGSFLFKISSMQFILFLPLFGILCVFLSLKIAISIMKMKEFSES